MLKFFKKFFNDSKEEVAIPDKISLKITIGTDVLPAEVIKSIKEEKAVVNSLGEQMLLEATETESTTVQTKGLEGVAEKIEEESNEQPANRKIKLTEEEKKKLGIDFEGDVYCCGWGELPINLKGEKKLKEMSLITPKNIAAKIRTKRGGIYDLYNIEEAKKMAFSTTYSPLQSNEWVDNLDKYVVLDTETTGIDEHDEIIQLSIVSMNGDVLFDSHFKPTVKSHPKALKVHKLTNKFLSDKPRFADKWNEIEDVLKDKVIIIHNKPFDVKLINQTCERYGLKSTNTFDTRCSLQYFKKKMNTSKLEEVLKRLNLINGDEQLHNSLIDCQMVVKALNAFNN